MQSSDEGIILLSPQPVTIVPRQGPRFRAKLLSMDSQRLDFQVGNQRYRRPASDYETVQTEDEIFNYNQNRKMFESTSREVLARSNPGDLSLKVTISLAPPLKWQEVRGVLRKIERNQTVVVDVPLGDRGETRQLKCPPGSVYFVFLGNEAEYLGRWGKGKDKNSQFADGQEVYFLTWHKDAKDRGYFDGSRGVIKRAGPAGMPQTMTEHLRADKVIKHWKKTQDKDAAALKYTWSAEWAKEMDDQENESDTVASRALAWWKSAGALQREFIKDVAACGVPGAEEVFDNATRPAEAGNAKSDKGEKPDKTDKPDPPR
jgi:hypothetical protein